jgi:hypothetical protein
MNDFLQGHMLLYFAICNLGVIQQLRGQNLAIFLTQRGQFLYPKRGQKQTFFDHLPPPSSRPRSY